ncbi:GNAT family N-acetyltransferase [Erythrobacter sp.]|uniref:GNAT family N-acetyltransferase n=1 Tax=Erythrobacter sp. TaxID=1042 RepID=UPI001425ECEB|nr:GNAT family N-acetyltransferase [Erythrobacter sp.]QIQ87498.1 MAG: GNAT family N-acetyltransferase [Erythrobacter sp.]
MGEFRRETTRLVLRDWCEADWDEFFRLTDTPAVMRWLGGPLGAEGRRLQRERVTTCRARNGFCFWVVERLADGGHLAGEMLGFCGLKRADAPGSSIADEFEVGWRFREDSWGRVYAKEAALAALDLAFGTFEADEVFAITVPDNTASWGLMIRLGMERRPELDYDDTRFTGAMRRQILYSITRDQWESSE